MCALLLDQGGIGLYLDFTGDHPLTQYSDEALQEAADMVYSIYHSYAYRLQ